MVYRFAPFAAVVSLSFCVVSAVPAANSSSDPDVDGAELSFGPVLDTVNRHSQSKPSHSSPKKPTVIVKKVYVSAPRKRSPAMRKRKALKKKPAPVPRPRDPLIIPDEFVPPPGETPYPEDGPACFPEDATVQLHAGATKRMDALAVGDRVKVAPDAYSGVYTFTHRVAAAVHAFVRVETASGDVLTLSPGHCMYANGALAAAETITAGDAVELGSGGATTVQAVSRVAARGLYNPQTLHGDIVVNNVRASTYTTAIAPSVAHTVLAPLRALLKTGAVADPSFALLESGVRAVPSIFQTFAAALQREGCYA
jgi:Hint module